MTGDVSGFPRRDEDGRVIGIRDLLAIAFAATLAGLAVLAAIDGLVALFGATRFGQASGWLAAVLPFLVLADDYRAWRPVRSRWLIALVGFVAGLLLGLPAAAAASYLPPLLSGAVGAAVAVLGYAIVWYVGVRRLR